MAYKSHYIPRFIMRNFGDQCDLYRLKSQKYEKGLVCYQAFYKLGLYTDEVENLTSELERRFVNLVNNQSWKTLIHEDAEVEWYFRDYLFFSLLRTPQMGRFFEFEEWNGLLKRILTEGSRLVISEIYGRTDVPDDRWYLLLTGHLHAVDIDPSWETFLLSTNGVTFLDDGNAIYPYAKHKAILVTPEDSPEPPQPTRNDILDINATMMHQAYNLIAFSSFDEDLDSFFYFAVKYPKDFRYSKLVLAAAGMCRESWITHSIRQKSGIENLHLPNDYVRFIMKTPGPLKMEMLRNDRDYGTLAAIEVLVRFGMLDRELSTYEYLRKTMLIGDARRMLKRYDTNAISEFDKCIAVIFLEYLSESGDGESSDRLRRYYAIGRHVIQDSNKSLRYLDRGCRLGYPDCLVAYYKSIGECPDYREKMERYPAEDYEDFTVCLMISKIYLMNGDEENYLKYLKKAADMKCPGAINQWVSYWVKKDPTDLEHIELYNDRIINHQINAALVLGQFYHDNEDMYPGRFERFIRELSRKPNVFANQLIRRYNVKLD